MSGHTVPIDATTREALAGAVVDGVFVTIPGQLAEAAWDKVREALTLLGGVYVPRKGFRFEVDPAPLLVQASTSGRVPGHPRTVEGFVRTPTALARRLVLEYAELDRMPGTPLVLEPSAGDGALVAAILAAHPAANVTAVEPNRARAARIPGGDGRVQVSTQEFGAYVASTATWFDVVIMNPPFAQPGLPTLWMDHVKLAWKMLAPGGRLVSVIPSNIGFRENKAHTGMRNWISQWGGWVDLPTGTFRASGTELSAAVLWLDKPHQADQVHPYLIPVFAWRDTPVRVTQPVTHRWAPRVQVRYDPWTGGDQVLRYWGRCAVCPRTVWGFDTGGNDPRGPLGKHSGGWSLDPSHHDATGPNVAVCVECAGSQETHEQAVRVAWRHWTPATGPTGPVQLDLFDGVR